MKTLRLVAPAAALFILVNPSLAGDLSASVDLSIGGLGASAEVGLGDGSAGDGVASLDVDLNAGLPGSLGTPGIPGTPGTPGTPGNGGTALVDPSNGSTDGVVAPGLNLGQLVGMAVVSSDRKLLGVLESARHQQGRIELTIALAPSLDLSVPAVTVFTDRMPAVSEVIRLRMTFSHFLSQI